MQTTKREQINAQAAMRAAMRKGVDPYNSHSSAAKQYPRIAALRNDCMRSEADANRHLTRQ